MNRYRLTNAIDKVRGYFLPRPHENTPEWRERAFRRAKNECLQALRNQIADIDALTWPQYQNSGKTDLASQNAWLDCLVAHVGRPRISRIDGDADLVETTDGEICTACHRPSIECSRDPCPAVIEDREEG
jgi:hypothetical protein